MRRLSITMTSRSASAVSAEWTWPKVEMRSETLPENARRGAAPGVSFDGPLNTFESSEHAASRWKGGRS